MMTAVIEVTGLTKRYGGRTGQAAVDDISFHVDEGEIFGILGPNGAGKTTAVECMEGLRRRDGGEVRILGLDPRTNRHLLHQRIGVQLQETQLQEKLRVREALELYASFYPNPADWHELLERWGLTGKADTRFAKLSGGQKQRLFIALALVGNPEVVFLDELTAGLDPGARHATWDLIAQIRDSGVTVVLVSHFMDEVEELCDRVAILERGRIAALDTPAGLGLTGVPMVIGQYRERGILRRLAATPVRPLTLLLADLMVWTASAIVSVVLLIAVARWGFGVPAPHEAGWFVLSVFLGIAALFSLGLLVAAAAPTARSAAGLGWLLFFPNMFFAGVYFPTEEMSPVMRQIGNFTPLGSALHAVRDSWMGVAPRPEYLGIMAAYAVVAAALSARFFRWEQA